jgi:hypothetical protein
MDVAAAQHVQQLSAGRHRPAGVTDGVELVGRRHQVRQRFLRVAQHDEQRPFARIGEVHGALEQSLR